MLDVLVIGAGPVGLACAIEAGRQGLSARVIDKGTLVNSIVGYPARMEFFSTPELIEIGGYPFPVRGYKPTREDALEYYRAVAAQRAARRQGSMKPCVKFAATWQFFRGHETAASTPPARSIVSTGFFDQPNTAGRAGRTVAQGLALLPRALWLCRPEGGRHRRQEFRGEGGARLSSSRRRVTLIVRSRQCRPRSSTGSGPTSRIGSRKAASARSSTPRVAEIREEVLVLNGLEGRHEIDNDWVLAMTGYFPDFGFLERLGPVVRRRRASHADLSTRRRSRPAVRGCISPAPCAADTSRASGSSRMAASMLARSPPISRKGAPSPSRSTPSTGRRRNSRSVLGSANPQVLRGRHAVAQCHLDG